MNPIFSGELKRTDFTNQGIIGAIVTNTAKYLYFGNSECTDVDISTTYGVYSIVGTMRKIPNPVYLIRVSDLNNFVGIDQVPIEAKSGVVTKLKFLGISDIQVNYYVTIDGRLMILLY